MALDAPIRTVPMTLYTEQYVVRGAIETHEHRVTDILNEADQPFLVLEAVSLEELGSSDAPTRAEFAHITLGSILFAVSLQAVEPARGLRTLKVAARAFVSIPPFRVIGTVHLLPERTLRDSLADPRTPFIPVTDAVFWSNRPQHGRQHAAMVAVNQARAQILAPYDEDGPPGLAGRAVPSALPTWLPSAPGGAEPPGTGSG
jgi:hypothetical protein